MLREKLAGRHVHKPHEFRWRSREISRLEGLSDAVFGFAITLLIVALEVPRTSGELLETMRGFISFAMTFAIAAIVVLFGGVAALLRFRLRRRHRRRQLVERLIAAGAPSGEGLG